MNFIAPPHIDHWTTALIWIISEFCRKEYLDGVIDLGDHENRRNYFVVPDQMTFSLAYSGIMRCHPLYERFVAANAVTESELVYMLVDKAQGSTRAAHELTRLPPAEIKVIGLERSIAEDLRNHAVRLLPPYFKLTLD